MKILSLPHRAGKVRLSSGVFIEHIDQNDSYQVNVYTLSTDGQIELASNGFYTFYVMEGKVRVSLSNEKGESIETHSLNSGQGWLLLPSQTQIVTAESDTKLFVIQNSSPMKQSEIMERGKKILLKNTDFNTVSDYIVHKPWGSEQWFVDTDVYVFKGIRMNSGFECSLQLHEQKIEVNLLMEGQARLLLGQSFEANAAIAKHHANGGTQADFSMPNEEVEALKNSMKTVVVGPGEGWKAGVYDIHQVLSLNTYFALEVSTPEVDDIIRLKDLYNRPGGRIESEHTARTQGSLKSSAQAPIRTQ